jgi:protein-L-isoaspartate O-methyltransferase
MRYAVGIRRQALVRSWRARPLRLREPFFSVPREAARIRTRCARAASDPAVSLHVWETHAPVLLELLDRLERPRVLELGMGYGSTPLVLTRSASSVSLETDPSWLARFTRYQSDDHRMALWESYTEDAWTDCPFFLEPWDIVFVDNAPARSRQGNLLAVAPHARFVICHDTEETRKPAASDYRWDFSSFRHVWTYTRFSNYTTVVSNVEPIPLGHLPGIDGAPPARERDSARS